MTPGRHGNRSHGISTAITKLQKGRDFTGLALEYYRQALARYGYSEGDLEAMGTAGAIVDKTSKLHAIVDLLWSALMGAASMGHVVDFIKLEARYGNRLTQSLTYDYKLLELQQQERDGVLDYERVLESERGDNSTD
jgi:hypothetical protein